MTQPITDIKVSYGQDFPPGFVQVPVDLNWGTLPQLGPFCEPTNVAQVGIHYHRWPDQEAPITALGVIVGRKTKTPSGWIKDEHDLNHDAGGNFIYVIWKKGGPELPILDILVQAGGANSKDQIVLPARSDNIYKKIPVDLNRGAKHQYIYLYYLQDTSPNTLQAEPPGLHDYHAMIEWVNQPLKVFELSRAQVRHDRLLIHTQTLVVDYDHFITADTPHTVIFKRIEGTKQSEISEVSKEISFSAGADFKKWGLGISAKLGYKKTEKYTREITVEERIEREDIFNLTPVSNARQIFICHVADVLTVYDIPSGEALARVVNDTNIGGTYMRNTEDGLYNRFEAIQVPT